MSIVRKDPGYTIKCDRTRTRQLLVILENAAYGRPTNQKDGSSSENASFAVDDVITTCSSSKAELPGWWSVELDEETTIKIVVIKTCKLYFKTLLLCI